MTKMTSARQTYKSDTFLPSLDQMTKLPNNNNDNDDNIPHYHFKSSQNHTQTLMLDSILWLNLSKTLECVFASSTVHCTHQQLLSIAWAISGTVGVWGWRSMKFILWTSCIWDSFLPGCIARMCLHLFIHLFILFCIDLIWIRPDWSYFACVSIFDNFYFCGAQQILGATHGAHSGGFKLRSHGRQRRFWFCL